MGEVRLVGERTPDLPESGSDGSGGGSGSSRLWRVGGGQVGGSTPEDRLLVKMAAARGVSGCRGGSCRRGRSRQRADGSSADSQVARLLEARDLSGRHGQTIGESGRNGQRGCVLFAGRLAKVQSVSGLPIVAGGAIRVGRDRLLI